MFCLHELVEQQTQKTPTQTAIRFGELSLTYQELDNRATLIAQHLLVAGARADQPVGLYCHRNLDLIPCVLGILKAGGAFLPLDPQYPAERTALVLEEARLDFVLTHSDLRNQLPPTNAHRLVVDQLPPLESCPPLPKGTPQQLAYVIFTSGSTGTPKGVAVEHQNVVNLVQWAHATFAPETYRAVLASTSLSFDISVFEIFVPLTWGGTVVLVENVLALFERQPEVTLLNSVPSAVQALVQENCLPASVRVVNLAGEPLSPKLVDQLYALGTVEHVYDLYGPTETTVYSTWARREAGASATIGKPIAQTDIVILDDHGNPVPDGHTGELLIGGAGIARGYLNRPELTAQRFVQHQGRRFYKTGDVVFRRGDGNLIYQGRQDQQVKIRGYRIELGEIESVLHQHPAVERSVVLAHERPSGQKYLVAYLLGKDVPSAALSEFLATKLPEYMIPQAFYFVSAFPTTPNGKLDRQALLTPTPHTLHARFASQAAKTPDAIALTISGEHLTYAELDRRANRLANHLTALGVGPETLVGLLIDRSFELVIGILGILKVGGAYVPLAPTAPPERLAFQLTDSAAPVLVTRTGLVTPETSATLVYLDRLPHDDTPPAPAATEENLAYVIYTSGSTGKPKGCLVEHRNVLALLDNTEALFHFTPQDVWTLFHSYAFDFSVWELWGALLFGGRLVIPTDDERRAPDTFRRLLQREQVTVLNQTPTAFLQLIQADLASLEPLTHLRTIIFAGEALSVRALQPWFERYGDTHPLLVNMYGITETTVHVTYRALTLADLAHNISPLGKALPGWDVQVHNGEIWVGGAGVTRGYLNRPELTAERFVVHDGQRFYRSGDLVRVLENGELDYAGRADQQVKLRGHRIELGEIESALCQIPGIQGAVVTLVDAHLVAYTFGKEVPAATLTATLRESLPAYMLPTHYVSMDAFPLTLNGKLDRSKLVPPKPQRLLDATSSTAPQSDLEFELASLWEQVLQTAPVGIHDNFFALGGHSLAAAQIVARLNRRFQTGFSIRLILEFPTIARLAPVLQEATQSATPLLHPAPRPERLPLSFAQERLWFLQELIPESPFYNIPIVTRLQGPLEVRALERSIQQLVERHEALRTIYERDNDLPIQCIQPTSAFPLTLEPFTEVARDTELNTPFVLETGPLFRARLWQVSETEHLLLLLVHHSVADGWSFNLIQKEVRELYRANRNELPAPLPPLSLQYADYALWHRQWLDESRLNQQLTYWKAQLQGVPTLTLPTDRPRPPKQSYAGATLSYTLPTERVEQVKAFSKEHQVTLYMTLFAVFSVFLGHYSTQDDIVIGTPIAGRNQPELEDLVGFFVNTLVLRCDLSGSPSFQELLQRTRRTVLDGFSHQDVPFEKLVEVLQPERDLSRNPLFQVLFVLQDADIAPETVEGVHFALERIPTKTAKFDLNLEIVDNTESLECRWEFSTDLFDPSTIARFHQHFETLLIAALESPSEALPALRLLTEEEQQTLTQTWNATATATPTATTVTALFEQQVRRTPSATALRFGESSLTYEELDHRANGLARALLEQGARANVPIAVHLHRSPQLIVAILAIWKVGAPYLPLDPTAPLSRKELLLAQAEVEILLTDTAFPTFKGRVLRYDPAVAPRRAPAAPSVDIALDDLAYVLYTSGSTGTPKGVGMPHRALANVVLWQQSQSDPAPTTLQFTSLSFDVSVQEIASTLITGGTLVLITEQEQRDSRALLEIMEREHVERLYLPFIALASLAEVANALQLYPSSLRDIITAGEQLQITPAIATLFRGLPHARLTNQYGPTETHVATAFTLRPPVDTWPTLPPIGTPIANTRVFVLDHRQELVPIGVPGELYIGGEGLAQGYVGAQALTDSRFVSVRGERLYRTGDLVKWDASGQLLFLGRQDHQVKIRGYRVELSEVEAALRTHPAVREAAVVAQELGGGKELVTFVVPTSPDAVTPQALRTYLADRLPEYMIPAFVTFCPGLPLTPSGKVDRKALPQIDHHRPLSQKEYTPAQTPDQALLVALWEDVLGVHPIGIHDNFFDLGGHSLKATQVVARIRNTANKDLSLSTFFEAPTISQLALSLNASHQSTLPPLVAGSGDTLAPLSFGQERFWFLDQLEGGTAHYLLPLLLEYHGELNLATLTAALETLITRHESLRTSFVTHQGKPVALTCEPEPLVLPLESFSEEALRTALETPFALSTGPLYRFRLWELAPMHYRLLFVTHHAIVDGGSLSLLHQELDQLYRAAVEGQALTLPPCLVQYADYAQWQRQWLSADTLKEQLDYWRTQLDALPGLTLSTDHSRPPLPSFRGQTQTYVLDQTLLAPLKALSRQNNTTLYMTLLAAFNLLLGSVSGQEDIVVGSPIAGRPLPQLEPLVGFFVNTLVLRNRFDPSLPFTAFLETVKHTTLAAMRHQDLPFEQLVAALNPVRDRSRNPLFQVQFTLQSDPLSRVFTELPPPVVNSALDLSLSVTERNDSLECRWEFATDLFDPTTIQRLQTHWVELLTRLSATPLAPCSAFLALPSAEEAFVRQAGQGRTVARPPVSVISLFEAQTKLHPDALALRCAGECLTYQQLHQKANQLANALQEVGAAPQQTIAIELERSASSVVALLAILKLGAAYLPIDAMLPPERAKYIREQAEPALTVTQEHFQNLETYSPLFESHPATEEEIAYVLFTSGSTGKPKGISIPHRALTNFLLSMQEAPGLTQSSSLVAVTTLSFDIAALEIFLPLITGAAVVLATPQQTTHPPALVALLKGASHLQATPATWRMLLDSGWTPSPDLIQLCGGEALPVELAARLLATGAPLWNLYGPTETTIWSTIKKVEKPEDALSIGTPIANTQVYVLNDYQQVVPFGVPGELYIGGAGLAQGYLKRPDLTQERFVTLWGERLYRTGDRVKWTPQGELEFLGRVDHQVKIRGFRVELPEIETLLDQHPQVHSSVVLAHQDRLVAYVTGGPVPLMELQAHLRRWLPEYMVPTQLVALDSFPLSPSGKIDRNALPSPEATRRPGTQECPRTPTEQRLCALWQAVLGKREIGVLDSFFEIGGHSLLAVQLFSRIEETFGRRIPLASLFTAPTIRALAEVLDRSTAPTQRWNSLLAIQPHGSQPPFFCVHAIGANVLNYRLLANYLGEDQPFYGFQSRGLDGISEPHTTVEAMAASYIDELKMVQPTGPYYLGGGSAGGTIAFEMARQLTERGEVVANVILIDTYHLPTWLKYSQRRRPWKVWARQKEPSLRVEKDFLQQVASCNEQALMSYQPGRYRGSVTQLLVAGSPVRFGTDPRCAWKPLVQGEWTVCAIPGTHDNMLDEPYVQELATILRGCLAKENR